MRLYLNSGIITPVFKTLPLETTKNLQKVSLIFFIIVGIAHIGSSLMIANDYFPKQSILVNRTIDIPFIIVALAYGLSSLKLSIAKYHKTSVALDVLFTGIFILIMLAAFYINFLVPDL